MRKPKTFEETMNEAASRVLVRLSRTVGQELVREFRKVMPKPPKPARVRELRHTRGWMATQMMVRTAVSGDRGLVTMIMGDGRTMFMCVAVETDIRAKDTDAVFDDHAHQTVGVFRGRDAERRAFIAGNEYIAKWLKSRKSMEKCACGPIDKKPTRKK